MIHILELDDDLAVSLFPLQDGDRVTLHAKDCPDHAGGECACEPLVLRGPSFSA